MSYKALQRMHLPAAPISSHTPLHFKFQPYWSLFGCWDHHVPRPLHILLSILFFCYHYFLLFLNWCSNTVVSIFPPPLSRALPTCTSYPQSHPPLALSMGSSFMFIYIPFPSFPPYFPLPSPLVTVSLLSVSMCLAIFLLASLFC